MDWKLLLLIAASHLASAFLAATIARQKARNSRMWFVAGLLFGLLGLIAAAGLPDRHQIVFLRPRREQEHFGALNFDLPGSAALALSSDFANST